MPRPMRPHDLCDVFRGSDARRAGVVTEHQLRGPAFRRLFRDVYVPAGIPVTHQLRCRGAALIVPPEAVLTGRSAATLHGVELAGPNDQVEFIVPERFRFGPISGIRVRRTATTARESTPWHGIRLATPLRTAIDLLLRHSPRAESWTRRLRTGVADLDAFLRAGLVSRDQLEDTLTKRRNRGVVLARHATHLTDTRAESRPESDLRVLLVMDGMKPTPQREVWQNGKLLGRLDLALDEEQIAVEYDGRWHNEPEQAAHDRARRERLEAAGWTFVIVTAEKLAAASGAILEEVRAARRRKHRLPRLAP
ncbi:MAG: DUF559 domain-containing protein [Pseudonocardiaceae bacterium]|nr:DUF559 domain-containing protein [Pseudonocardiaceae bacterium]